MSGPLGSPPRTRACFRPKARISIIFPLILDLAYSGGGSPLGQLPFRTGGFRPLWCLISATAPSARGAAHSAYYGLLGSKSARDTARFQHPRLSEAYIGRL